MIAILIFNLINFGIFMIYFRNFYLNNDVENKLIFFIIGVLAMFSFVLAALFYIISTTIQPGYVKALFEFEVSNSLS